MTTPPPILRWTETDDAPASSASVLLASFAAFYEEVAGIRRSQHDGTLAAYLTQGSTAAPQSDREYAERVAARLLLILQEQRQEFQRKASAQQVRMHQAALYLMAALADEILLLELDWPGAEHWVCAPLEKRLFGTCRSGQVFFDMADQLIKSNLDDPLHADLASVFLLALRLGFKGKHRNRHGPEILAEYRRRLYHIANTAQRRLTFDAAGDDVPRCGAHGHAGRKPAFLQAYQHRITDGKDQRLAPLSPWRNLLKTAALAYLLFSTLLWLYVSYPLGKLLNM